MISQEMEWGKIYDSGDVAKQIIKRLYAKRDYKELHAALWSWLSLDGTKGKWEWFKRFDVPAVSHYCFACEEAEISFRCNPPIGYALEEENDIKSPICYYCPLTSPSSEDCLNGLYGKWLTTYFEDREEIKDREEIAMEIANMEWK